MRRPDTVRLGRKEILLLVRERKGREGKTTKILRILLLLLLLLLNFLLFLSQRRKFIHRFVNVNIYVCNDIRVEDKPIQG